MVFVVRFLFDVTFVIDVKGERFGAFTVVAGFPGGVVVPAAFHAMRSDLLNTHVPDAIDRGLGQAGEKFSVGGSVDRHRILIRCELSASMEGYRV